MTTTLRPYQEAMRAEIYEAWRAGARNVCAVAPTGAGKTALKSAIFADMRSPAVAIAHRQELVAQISLAMAQADVTHQIIAPPALVKFCVQQHVRKLGRSFYHPQSPVAVAGVDTLLRRASAADQWVMQTRLWDIDECFPAGTLISTPDGSRPIEMLRAGDLVISFDETSGEFGVRPVLSTMRNPQPDMLYTVKTHRSKITCTRGHPFWTKRGWVEAGDLKPHDYVHVRGSWSRVEVLERGHPERSRDGFVYNIEVDEHHTYVANGFVVHNCHHVLSNNKWGKAVQLFEHAQGLGVTATPVRCDKKALGRAKSGVFDALVVGPSMRELINAGYLADYRIFAPPASFVMEPEDVSRTTGDFKPEAVRTKAHKSTITGDIVDSYLKFAAGKRGITFAVDVEQAKEIAAAYNARGVRAQAVSAKTPDAQRTDFVERFARGDLDQLINVDLFGEGFDVPAVEVVSMGRPTQSYGLYVQQFGRALRPSKGKTHGILIDHVGNVIRHGLPDRPRAWSLDDEEAGKRRRADDDVIPLTSCLACFEVYPRTLKICPHCGHVHVPAGRSAPEFVDGDLVELHPDVLARMRGEADRIMGAPQIPVGASQVVAAAIRRDWSLRQQAQQELREAIALWAGIGRDVRERTDSELYREFYFRFGVDVATAKTLNRADAEKLRALIVEEMV